MLFKRFFNTHSRSNHSYYEPVSYHYYAILNLKIPLYLMWTQYELFEQGVFCSKLSYPAVRVYFMPTRARTDSTSTYYHPSTPECLFQPTSSPVFSWGIHNTDDFSHALEATYSEVVHWRINNFKVPWDKVGKEFVHELSRLFSAFASASSMESIALRATIVLPILLLQKPHCKSKAKEHATCLEEAESLPKYNSPMAKQNLSRSFANVMFAGKTKAALDLYSQAQKGGVLHLDDPSDPNHPGSPQSGMCLTASTPKVSRLMLRVFSPLYPSRCTPSHLRFHCCQCHSICCAIRTTGSAGPSRVNAHGWRLCAPLSRVHLTDLCNSLALVAKRLCTSLVDPKCVSSLLACRLIALDKPPGVHPIGIGDTARRIIAKAILSTTKSDMQDASGCLQLCTGQLSGIEATVEAVRTAFESDENEAVLLADASNAFNSLNRQVTLHNILINTYRAPYGPICWWWCNTLPRRHYPGWPTCHAHVCPCDNPLGQETGWKIQTSVVCWWCGSRGDNCRPTWLVGQAIRLRPWLRPDASKTWLVTKSRYHAAAVSIFTGMGVNMTPEGRPYLGAAIGSREYVTAQVESKVNEWISCVQHLATLAVTQPHAAFSALTHGFDE